MLRLPSFVIATALVTSTLVSARAIATHSALPLVAAAPADNPTTPERVALGRLLFWDPILSGEQDVSCATCHHPDFAYAEGRDLSIGAGGLGLGPARTFPDGRPVRLVKRNSQTVLNAAFNGIDAAGAHDPASAPMFWDLRVTSLEAQAIEPLKALDEMRGNAYPQDDAVESVVERLSANGEYRQLFASAFGGRAPVSAVNLGRALAAFERSLVAVNSPFDRYMRGDAGAMTPQQVRGLERFEAAGCGNCHTGPMFSDFKPHVLAVPDNRQLDESDSGIDGTYAFRTAPLRNLAQTSPYMHNGVFDSLDDVVDFYRRVSRGGRGGRRGGRGLNANVARTDIDPLARQLNMRGRGERDIILFLGALNDDSFDKTIPDRVPSGLQVGGR